MTKLTGGATTTYTYDAADELTLEDAAGTLTTYTYDNNGNTLTINAAGSRTTMTWSDEDDLLTARPPSGGTVTMTYDGDHVRRRRQDASVTRKYVWDQEQLLLETGSGNATVIRYTLAPFGYGDLVSKRQSDTTHFYHYDALGSTRALTIGNQAVSDTYLYQALGETIASTGGAVNSFRYVGKLGYFRETAIDGYLLRRRYYRPGLGRFVSPDPEAEPPGDYVYVAQSPLRTVDASGLRGDAVWRRGIATGYSERESRNRPAHDKGAECCAAWGICVDDSLIAGSSLNIRAELGSRVKCRVPGTQCNVTLTIIDTGARGPGRAFIDLLPGAVNALKASCGHKRVTSRVAEDCHATLECTVLPGRSLRDNPRFRRCEIGRDCYKDAPAEHCVNPLYAKGRPAPAAGIAASGGCGRLPPLTA